MSLFRIVLKDFVHMLNGRLNGGAKKENELLALNGAPVRVLKADAKCEDYNAQLCCVVQNVAARLKHLDALTKAVLASGSMDDALRTALGRVRDAFAADTVAILL